MNFNVTFTPAAPVGAYPFGQLVVSVTDSAGVTHESRKSASQVDAEKTDNGDGSYTVPMAISSIAVGNYSGSVESLDTTGATMGTPLSITGTITIEEGGTWFAQPTGAVAV